MNVKEGTFAGWGLVRGFCCTSPDYLILSQTISVLASTDYVVGFFLSNQSSSGVGFGTGDLDSRIQIYVDGIGLLPATTSTSCPLDCLHPSIPWRAFSSSFNSRASTSVTIDFRIIASGTGYVGLSIDDTYVVGAAGPRSFQ